jgi:proteic killer suppression protein
VIVRFRHDGLELLHRRGSGRKLSAQHVTRLRLILAALETASHPADMALPGLRLHPLKGDRAGQWAVSVSGHWRVVFEFDGVNVTNVDLVDYH